MALKSFSEYLGDNGKLNGKGELTAITSLNADTSVYPKIDKPGKAQKKGKGWHTEAAVVDDDNGPFAYKGDGKDPGLQMAGDDDSNVAPLGSRDVPQSGMVYHPKTDPSQNINVDIDTFEPTKSVRYKVNAPGKTVDYGMPTPPRPFNKAEKPYNQQSEYKEFMRQADNASVLHEVINVSNKIGKNLHLLESFVREIKRNGDFANLMVAILNQPEAFSEIAINVAADEGKARQIAKALNETVAEPIAAEEDEDTKSPKKSMNRKKDFRPQEPASEKMPPKDDTNVQPDGSPPSTMMRPEHALIQALANYKNIRETMQEVLGR